MSTNETRQSDPVEAVIMRHGGVFCCQHKDQCRWQCFMLHGGLGWGTIPRETNLWRQAHDERCGGKLIQLMDPADGSNCREGIDQFGRVVKST